ncbi:MAG TPA: glycerophosphodiester phosphodiesterase family protein [Prolixibacteraceae bacterium]|nr:glycerophosphodiester phosphodiesterase family protein [Prolixibacteraceae bacterium]
MYRLIILWVFVLIGSVSVAQISVIAHRGASYLAPENTLASINLAWELGADAVEIDVHLSADMRIMVIHDPNTKRVSTWDVSFTVAESTAEQLRAMDVGSHKSAKYAGEKIPFLEEVLETVSEGKFLVIEIKCGEEIIPYLKKAVDESGKMEQLVFISFDWETILAAHEAFPQNRSYYLKMLPFGLASKMRKAAELGLTGVNLYHGIINPELMKKASLLGLEVLAWTVDNPATVLRLEKLGVKAITTNRPGWMRKQIEGS